LLAAYAFSVGALSARSLGIVLAIICLLGPTVIIWTGVRKWLAAVNRDRPQHRPLSANGNVPMPQVFDTVWYLPHENRWRDLNLLAYRDSGKLIVRESSIEFSGHKESAVINNIRRVTLGKQGRDFINDWVKIEYGDSSNPSIAFFADGSMHGWGGIFGGTKQILEAVKRHVQGPAT